MAQKTRVLQKVFAEDAPTVEVGQIGSLAAGAAATTKDLATIQSLAQYLGGLWDITNNSSEPPRIEDINALYFLITSQLKYLFQNGIPEWISTEKYYADVSFVSYGGELYQAILGDDVTNDNTNQQPDTATTFWGPVNLNALAVSGVSAFTGLATFAAGLTSNGTINVLRNAVGSIIVDRPDGSQGAGFVFKEGGTNKSRMILNGSGDMIFRNLDENTSEIMTFLQTEAAVSILKLLVETSLTMENNQSIFLSNAAGDGNAFIRVNASDFFLFRSVGTGYLFQNEAASSILTLSEDQSAAFADDLDVGGVLTVNDFVQAVGEYSRGVNILSSVLFGELAVYIPNTSDKMRVMGSISANSGIFAVERNNSTTIKVYYGTISEYDLLNDSSNIASYGISY